MGVQEIRRKADCERMTVQPPSSEKYKVNKDWKIALTVLLFLADLILLIAWELK